MDITRKKGNEKKSEAKAFSPEREKKKQKEKITNKHI